MSIFTIKNNVPTIDVVGLNIPEFRAIWVNDKSRSKSKAKGELAYVYHMISASSPYFSLPELEKKKTIIDAFIPLDVRASWKESEAVKTAMKAFIKMPPNNSPSIRMLRAANGIADKLARYFDDVDFSAINEETGQLLYDPKRVVDTMKSLSAVINEIKELEITVKKDLSADDTQITGGAVFSIFDV